MLLTLSYKKSQGGSNEGSWRIRKKTESKLAKDIEDARLLRLPDVILRGVRRAGMQTDNR